METILKRISCEETMLAARSLWNPEVADDIGSNALQILAQASRRTLIFFNGKASKCLLGGLFYILGYRFNHTLTQKEIADKIGTSEISISHSYKCWLKEFPELFTDVMTKMIKLDKGLNQNHCFKQFDKALLESVDEALSSLGEKAKTSIYFHLEHKFMVRKQDIPFRIEDFSDALERILGPGAQSLEILFMEKLHSKVEAAIKWRIHEWPESKWTIPEMTFSGYVQLMRQNFEATQENKAEIGIIISQQEKLIEQTRKSGKQEREN